MKTIYQQLKPEIKSKINQSATQYSTAKRLKYTLMAKRWWSDLTVSELGDIISYGGIGTVDVSPHGYLFGKDIIQEKN